MSPEDEALNSLYVNEPKLIDLARAMWEDPEVGLQEDHAARLIADRLKNAGFSLAMGVGQMPTAFVASWGKGNPIIGILGEYDALPGLSQKVRTTREPIAEGAPGHGCGHNLLGVGALGASLAVKKAMEKGSIHGTIRYYGCPAEETLVGKVFMARDGVFDDLNTALTWHPSDVNTVLSLKTLAMNSFKVNFHGVAAHAGWSPESGRSALDGVQLMDIGVNYMREHIVQEARVHCVITEGGKAPNVVPPYAQAWYYVRAPNRDQVDQIYAWMCDIAKGAALMSGTTCDIEFLTGCYDTLPNEALEKVLLEKLAKVNAPRFTAEERDFARKLQETFPHGSLEKSVQHHKLTDEEAEEPLCEKIIEPRNRGEVMGGSTDVGDVSYLTPTAQILTCCQALGTPGHSWQNVAASGSSIGFKGMMVASRALAVAALDLLIQPDILKAAREEFEKRTKGRKYRSPLPEEAAPRSTA
jgi:aminobenzoyl-glutamate utilization protein B